MRKVRDCQLAHPWKETDRNWIRATYYTGVMGLYRTTEDREAVDGGVEHSAWASRSAGGTHSIAFLSLR